MRDLACTYAGYIIDGQIYIHYRGQCILLSKRLSIRAIFCFSLFVSLPNFMLRSLREDSKQNNLDRTWSFT